MDLTRKLAISYYKTIAVLNEQHNIYLVQHQETKNIYVKKILDVYNLHIYERLYNSYVTGTPKIIDYYEENDRLTIIEEYISGISLQEKIWNSELSEADILHYMIDLCNILEQLHSMKPAVIHRDIKPSNIIITSYNKAVLLDFNAAKNYSPSSTEDTVFLGTQGYAAPEQYGFGASCPQTDIYSLGILLKEMTASVSGPIGSFDFMISKCTQMDPLKRFGSITELRDAVLDQMDPERRKTNTNCASRFLPPGYRTKTPWKMMVSSIGYLFVGWLCLSLKANNTVGVHLWLERFFLLGMVLSVVFGCFNYLNIQKYVPLCRHKNIFIHYIGIILLDGIMIISLFLILILIEEVFFHI